MIVDVLIIFAAYGLFFAFGAWNSRNGDNTAGWA